MSDDLSPAAIRTLVSGHRNPDIDSLAAATALAELRRRQGNPAISAICPGILPDRAAYLFQRFHLTAPVVRNDVYVRVGDVMVPSPVIRSGTTLFDAVAELRNTELDRLPVIARDCRFLGMLSGSALLSHLLSIGSDDGSGLTGRRVVTSLAMIRQVLEGEFLTSCEPERVQEFEVYVAAMSPESFEEHLPHNNHELAVIVGDRPEIHLRALHRRIRLLIVTGRRPVDSLIQREAEAAGVSILCTALDSATVIRRLKFSVPVEYSDFAGEELTLSPSDRLRDVRGRLVNSPDVIPVVDGAGILVGVVLKAALHALPPFRLILVDHNEIEQSPAGAEEIPVVEVVDHHRIGMNPTTTPIKFTGDVVGSTCTLVAAMYRSSGESLNPEMAGLLLGGIVSDTLMLKSPTTAALDIRMCEWLEKIAGIKGEELMAELMRVDSPLTSKSAAEVINGDRKNYTDGGWRFGLAQVEESNLELLHNRHDELAAEIRETVKRDGLDFFGLMVTDAVRANSELLAFGKPEILRLLPYARIGDGPVAMPGGLRRKKQLLPQMLALTSALQHQE